MSDEQNKQWLSDLMDGHVDGSGVVRACAAWRGDVVAREDWHLYHVIGDVLRTPELAPRARHRDHGSGDAAFLAAVRARLVLEPVVLMPEPVPHVAAQKAAASERPTGTVAHVKSGWRAPMAVAAGFMAVAAVVAVTRMGGLGTGPAAPVLATAPEAATTTVATSPSANALVATSTGPATAAPAAGGTARPSNATVMLVNDQRMVRDARLDRYLAAHRQFGDGPVGALPGGVVRSVSSTAPER